MPDRSNGVIGEKATGGGAQSCTSRLSIYGQSPQAVGVHTEFENWLFNRSISYLLACFLQRDKWVLCCAS
jgi:hypothetical protein